MYMYTGNEWVFLCVSVHLNTLTYWYPRILSTQTDLNPVRHATPHLLPLSFTILSLPQFLPVSSCPPPSSSHPHCPPLDRNYNSVDTLTPQGPSPAFFCPAASVSLSVCPPLSPWVCMFLSHSVSVHTSVFLSLSSSLSTSETTGVSFSFCPPTNCPSGSFCALPAPCVFLSLPSSFLIL